jgi:hypothetical protein
MFFSLSLKDMVKKSMIFSGSACSVGWWLMAGAGLF